MANDDFTPDLSKLEQDYQILTELQRSPDSRTYLARHLELNRDVTITVVRRDARGATGTGAQSLSRYAGDVERLKTSRHPNVIPVLEGRWLADGSFAVVRARARGASLDQLVSASGAMQTARVASALEQVQAALDWARDNAVANRSVDPSAMIFQQGSGRVLLSFEPRLAGVAPDDCEDARLIGRLGWEMLAGEPFSAAQVKSLAALRPDLPPQAVSETEALMRCAPGSTPDISGYIALLSGAAPVLAVAAVPAADVVVAAPAVATPVGAQSDAVVVQKRGWGFGTRFAVGVAVVATIAIVAFLFMHPSAQPIISRTAAGGGQQTAGEAAGDVAPSTQPDTAVVASPSTPGYPQSQFSAPAPNPTPSMYPQSTYPQSAYPQATTPAPQYVPPTTAPMPATVGDSMSRLAPPLTRRHEPLITTPSVRMEQSDSARASLDSLRAKQDSLWSVLDRKLKVHSDTTVGTTDTARSIPVTPPVVDTTRKAPPDSVTTTFHGTSA